MPLSKALRAAAMAASASATPALGHCSYGCAIAGIKGIKRLSACRIYKLSINKYL